MSFPNTNNARRRGSRTRILLDQLRLALRFRVRVPEIHDVPMKRLFVVFGLVVLMMGANSAFAQVTQRCAIATGGSVGATGLNPAYIANQDGRADEGCTILITLNADGSIKTTHPNPAASYDNGIDDNIIAVVNNTAKTITG